ncbi:MAG: hypothetical protein ABIC68_06875 [Candidatus Omnitrophota bacterium]
MRVNKHSIIVASSPSEAFVEIVRWGEASWWPKASLMSFKRQTQGEIREGTVYRQKVMLPFAPSWNAEVKKLTDSSITRMFFDGMFEGCETVGMAARADGLEIVYEMHYRLKGVFNRLMWSLIFNKLHDQNIEMILRNLKEYLERGDQKACI